MVQIGRQLDICVLYMF